MNLAKKRHADLAAAPAEGFAVDPATGTLANVALLTVGPTVDGRFYIDAQTLATGHAAISRRGGKVRIYPSHNHAGAPKNWKEVAPDDSTAELNFAAYVDGVAIKKSQLVGGKLEFYDAFKKNYAPQFEGIVELAAKTPDLLGLSLEPIFHLVYVDKKGVEYSAWPEKVDLAYEGLPAMRIDDIFTAAFGSVPAANPGLFAKLTAKFGGKRSKKLAGFVADLVTVLRADLSAAPAASATSPAAVSTPVSTSPTAETVHSAAPLVNTPSSTSLTASPVLPEKSAIMKIIADLQAKFGSDEKRLGQAMLIVGKTPADKQADLTVAGIEAQLVTADLTAAIGQVAKLTADLGTRETTIAGLNTQITDLTAQRDDFKRQLEVVKASGLARGLDLGAPSSGAGGNEENPFLTTNLTAQSALWQQDPIRAQALQQAAANAKAVAAAKK